MATTVLYRPVKKLGQNFLIDNRVASRVVATADLTPRDTVLEPGAGYGTLTRVIANRAGRVLAVEKDRRLASHLKEKFATSLNVLVLEGDVLKIPLPQFNKVVGTPPYALSSKLFLYLTRKEFEIASLVFQKEFGERLLAKPGSPDYGRLSITVQRSFNVEPIMGVPAAAFRPKPKVDSILLRIVPRRVDQSIDAVLFEELVRGLFNQRRRVVKSSLSHYLSKKVGRERARAKVKEISLPEKRVYQLTIADLEEICQQLSQMRSLDSD